jgi:hypothetical protein
VKPSLEEQEALNGFGGRSDLLAFWPYCVLTIAHIFWLLYGRKLDRVAVTEGSRGLQPNAIKGKCV